MSEKTSKDQYEDTQDNTINSRIINAINSPTHEAGKRKAVDQNSAEKPKGGKILKDSPPTTTPKTKVTMGENNETGARPKMIRAKGKDLNGIECASAYHTYKAIVVKDATHPVIKDHVITPSEARNAMSDHIISNKHTLMDFLDSSFKALMVNALAKKDDENKKFFENTGDNMTKIATSSNQQIMAMMNNTNLKKLTGTHHEAESTKLAAEFATQIPTKLMQQKEELLPYLLKPSRTAALTKDLHELVVRNINMSNKWLLAIHATFPTAAKTETNFTISNRLHTLQEESDTLTKNNTELDHQIAKIAQRMGDMKTSELEQRFSKVENMVRLHNINFLNEGTENHFRNQTEADKHKTIIDLVHTHTNANTRIDLEIIQPQSRTARQFESLAIITFRDPKQKFIFEKNFAIHKRATPNYKPSISRATPPKASSDRDQPDPSDIKSRIGMLYNQKIAQVKAVDPTCTTKSLTTAQIDSIQCVLKTKYRPFATWWEFLCPNNNCTFMTYIPEQNPFDKYDFKDAVPNPITRKHLAEDARYVTAYPIRQNRKK